MSIIKITDSIKNLEELLDSQKAHFTTLLNTIEKGTEEYKLIKTITKELLPQWIEDLGETMEEFN